MNSCFIQWAIILLSLFICMLKLPQLWPVGILSIRTVSLPCPCHSLSTSLISDRRSCILKAWAWNELFSRELWFLWMESNTWKPGSRSPHVAARLSLFGFWHLALTTLGSQSFTTIDLARPHLKAFGPNFRGRKEEEEKLIYFFYFRVSQTSGI